MGVLLQRPHAAPKGVDIQIIAPRLVCWLTEGLESPQAGANCQRPAILLRVFLCLVFVPHWTRGQEPPTSDKQAQPISQQQPVNNSSSGSQPSSSAAPRQETALDNPVLEQADEERNIISIQSRLSFTYDHDACDGWASFGCFRVNWLQSFGSSHSLAAEIELPFAFYDGGNSEPSSHGLGDITVKFIDMLDQGEKFEHAAGIEITAPSASSHLIGEGETVMKLVWGFSTQVTPHTLLSGQLGYNLAVQASQGHPGSNEIEPELILAQAFAKRVGGYIDWDSYYDFNASKYLQILKLGVDVELDRKQKWSVSPYFEFPLNHFTQTTGIKKNVGFEVSYHF